MHLVLLLVATLVASASSNLIVNTQSGLVQGNSSAYANYWKGIPYATPPVGPLRWTRSQPPQSWSGIKQTQEYGAACIQTCLLPPTNGCPSEMSEDCLTLNIFAPLNSSNASFLPVMFFIHGGGYMDGYSGAPVYDGSFLANFSNVIVVSANYRLGQLGFLYVDDIKGQFGVLDQRLALQWVQNNIFNFGGDPTRVTIFGQSAGANSVAFHLMSNNSWNLFNSAILQSNYPSGFYYNTSTANQHGLQFMSLVGCNYTECLQNVSVDLILSAQTQLENDNVACAPVIDLIDLNGQQFEEFAAGNFSHVPIMWGDDADEGRLFIYYDYQDQPTRNVCINAIKTDFPNDYKKVEAEYPIPHNENYDCRLALDAIEGDMFFTCANRVVGRSMAKLSSSPVYAYWFNHSFDTPGVYGPIYSFCDGHVCHSEELPFVFGTMEFAGFTPTPREIKLQSIMMSYWGNFAWRSDPNGAGLAEWPKYSGNLDDWMQMKADNCGFISDPRAEYCAFWDKVGFT